MKWKQTEEQVQEKLPGWNLLRVQLCVELIQPHAEYGHACQYGDISTHDIIHMSRILLYQSEIEISLIHRYLL
jgi:hypothetical protein